MTDRFYGVSPHRVHKAFSPEFPITMMQRISQHNPACRSEDGLSVYFWGVRGSFSLCGNEFVEFGGNTPCVEIRLGKRLFVIDSGTGFPIMGREIAEEAPLHMDLLLSHLHLDHIGGLMMCKHLLLQDKRVIRTYCGNLDGVSAEAALNTLFSPPLFPVTMKAVPARFEHVGFKSGETLVFEDGFSVRTIPLPHPGGATGYRFDHQGRAVCYLSDLEHSGTWPEPALIEFSHGADLIIFDGMFCRDDYCGHEGWGHSTWSKGIELCRAAEVGALAIFHLNPCYDDERLRTMERSMQQEMPEAFVARERHFMHFPPQL